MTKAPSPATCEAQRHCLSIVREQDEDFYLSSRYAGPADHARVIALFAFQIELRRIPHVVSEPALGEIRLQWFRDALEEVASGAPARAHPAIQAAAATELAGAGYRDDMERLIDARARLLYEPRFSSLADLSSFVQEAEVPLARIAAGDGAAAHPAIGRIAGAYALARFTARLAPDLSAEACAEAQHILRGAANAPAVNAGILGRVAYLGLARGYAQRPDGRAWPIAKRLAMFACVAGGRL
ncbi:MAG: squalene/phytoene synthase family protein [Parvularculaceae bacterium]|nr:squalene/phytoene synthase family protein [Parvularculaceae bacterium]